MYVKSNQSSSTPGYEHDLLDPFLCLRISGLGD
jgi:hypothetical protein